MERIKKTFQSRPAFMSTSLKEKAEDVPSSNDRKTKKKSTAL